MVSEDKDSAKKKKLLVPESSEPERSGGERNGGASNLATTATPPDPEVSRKPQRRRFATAYKARIVEEALACTEHGQIGALLRREGLYASALRLWRQQYQKGALQGLKDDKRGRKPLRDARDKEMEQLQRENERLNKKLQQAELIIDIQKKVVAMFGNPLDTPQKDETNS